MTKPQTGNAPIAIFAYRRAEGLARVLDALQACPEYDHSPVYIYSDGPKTEMDKRGVELVRSLVKARLKPNMKLIVSPCNRGLAASIMFGVSDLCERYGKVIVMEDDLVPSKCILQWFNRALDRYEEAERVMQVSGYALPLSGLLGGGNRFLPLTTSWGWATWKRAWDRFDPAAEGAATLLKNRRIRNHFNVGGAYPYSKMLMRQLEGKIDSWAIRWYWSVVRSNGVVLFPSKTLVRNMGQDIDATHKGRGRWLKRLVTLLSPLGSEVGPLPGDIRVHRHKLVAAQLALSARLL